MGILTQKLKRFKRKQRHIRRLRSRIHELKYQILNTAIKHKEVNSNHVDLFHKYNRRLKLITFLQNG
jgi:hypothetical protein